VKIGTIRIEVAITAMTDHYAIFLSKIDKNGSIPVHVPEIGNCWEWKGKLLDSGYGRLGIGGKSTRAHRASWFFSHGLQWPNLCVLHRCDNRKCVRPDHLFLGTQADNIKDKLAKLRQSREEKHGRSKVTKEQAIDILKRKKAGERQIDLASEFGINQTTVSDIGRRSWVGLTASPNER
jgi:hypothetical protein